MFRKVLPRNKWAVVSLCILLILLITGLALLYNHNHHKLAKTSPFLVQSLKEPVPTSQDDKVLYYQNIAQGYIEANDCKDAITALHKADTYITDHSVHSPKTVNPALFYCYKQIGDKTNARKYIELEINRLKPNPENKDAVRYLQGEEAKL